MHAPSPPRVEGEGRQ